MSEMDWDDVSTNVYLSDRVSSKNQAYFGPEWANIFGDPCQDLPASQ